MDPSKTPEIEVLSSKYVIIKELRVTNAWLRTYPNGMNMLKLFGSYRDRDIVFESEMTSRKWYFRWNQAPNRRDTDNQNDPWQNQS